MTHFDNCSLVRFNPVHGYWFTSYLVSLLKGSSGCFEATFDLGLTKTIVCLRDGKVALGDIELSINDVEPTETDRVVIVEKDSGDIYEVLVHSESGFYKLKAIDLDKAPTLEINGIHMHRIQGVNPWEDTLLKIKAARVRRNHKVLDTCMGLGYTAIASMRHGAVEVDTFEIDPNVLWIAERNPWSKELSSSKIRIHHGDVVRCVQELPSGYYDRVVHDPPRFSRETGDLYSLEFYRELYRVLKPAGILFHYTGEPRRHGAPSILKGIKRRLEEAGFKILKFDKQAQGFIALKTI